MTLTLTSTSSPLVGVGIDGPAPLGVMKRARAAKKLLDRTYPHTQPQDYDQVLRTYFQIYFKKLLDRTYPHTQPQDYDQVLRTYFLTYLRTYIDSRHLRH